MSSFLLLMTVSPHGGEVHGLTALIQFHKMLTAKYSWQVDFFEMTFSLPTVK